MAHKDAAAGGRFLSAASLGMCARLPDRAGEARAPAVAAGSRTAGATLIELLVLMAVIAVLAGAAISVFTGSADQAVEEAARRVAADITYARADAMAQGEERRVAFAVDGDSYAVLEGDSAAVHPITKGPFVVSLGRYSRGAGPRIQEADFGGSDTLTFRANGLPEAGGTLALQSAGTKAWRVIVSCETGRVTIKEE